MQPTDGHPYVLLETSDPVKYHGLPLKDLRVNCNYHDLS